MEILRDVISSRCDLIALWAPKFELARTHFVTSVLHFEFESRWILFGVGASTRCCPAAIRYDDKGLRGLDCRNRIDPTPGWGMCLEGRGNSPRLWANLVKLEIFEMVA